MLTNRHTIPDIVNFLMCIFRHCRCMSSNCPPKNKLKLTSAGLSLMASISRLTKKAWLHIWQEQPLSSKEKLTRTTDKKSILHVCSAHFLHLISKHLKKLCNQKKVRSFVLYCTAISTDCAKLESFRTAFIARVCEVGSGFETWNSIWWFTMVRVKVRIRVRRSLTLSLA